MNDALITLTNRISQANAHLQHMSREWYMGQMTRERFVAQRKDILDFIEEQSRVPDSDEVLDPDMQAHVLPKPIAKKIAKKMD